MKTLKMFRNGKRCLENVEHCLEKFQNIESSLKLWENVAKMRRRCLAMFHYVQNYVKMSKN